MKQFKIWAMALTAVMAVGQASAQGAEELGLKMKEAGELVNAKKYSEAIPALEKVVEMGVETEGDEAAGIVAQAQGLLPKIYLQLGVGQFQAKETDKAIASLLKAEELGELYGDATTPRQASRIVSNIYLSQGINNFNAKEYGKALETFLKGQKQDPENVKLSLYTAKSYAELDSLTQAIELYKKVVAAAAANSKFAADGATAEKDMETYILVATSKAAQAKDIATVETLVAAQPESAAAALILVQLANNLKKYDVVIANGAKAFEIQTDAANKSEVAYLLGVAYQNKENNAKAAEYLKKVTTGPNVAAAKELAASLAQ